MRPGLAEATGPSQRPGPGSEPYVVAWAPAVSGHAAAHAPRQGAASSRAYLRGASCEMLTTQSTRGPAVRCSPLRHAWGQL